jgi:hypothetical protein
MFMFIMLLTFVIFLSGSESMQVFLSLVSICIVEGDPVIKRNQEGRVRIPLTCLTPPHVCACPKSEPGFTSSYVVVFFVFSEER